MKCSICNNRELLRVHQLGVINKQRTVGSSEPEVLIDIMICRKCGAIKVDPDTIEIKENKGIYEIFNL